MKVYVFGNEDVTDDNRPFEIVEKIKSNFKGVNFIKIKPNEDLPFLNEKKVVILDSVEGIKKITIIYDLDKFKIPPRSSVHDFDLALQLKYLSKIGKIGEVIIIGIPMEGEIDYLRIQSILRKLVAQDMQGS
jgi:Ni,Fe-hydrogenase maturation factor